MSPRDRQLWLGVAGLAVGALTIALLPARALFVVEPPNHADHQAQTGERWACAMMDYIGPRPGDCPVCGMKLQKVVAGELSAEERRRMGIETTTIAAGPAQATVHAYGVVEYDEQTAEVLIPRVAGRVVRRHAPAQHAGTLVQAGDPVVELYSPEAYALQGELAAAVRLGDDGAVRALMQRLERVNLGAVARAIADGGEPTDTVTISSPFTGRVLTGTGNPGAEDRLPRVGQEVAADTPLLLLVDPAAFRMILQVPEPRAHWVRVGQRVRLATDDLGALRGGEAEVAWVAPELDRQLRSREVHVHWNDANGQLLAGALVHARIEAQLGSDLLPVDPAHGDAAAQLVLVPKTAILSTGVRNVVWRVVGETTDGRVRFEPVPVALGPRLESADGHDRYIVRAGLQAGDEVATRGAFLIDSQAQLAGTPSLIFPAGAVAPATHVH